MLLLRSSGRLLSPYSKTCMRASLELLTYPYGRNRAKTPVRRSLRGTAKEGQSNKKCSVSSMPSFEGRNGYMVSLKICCNFLKFGLLRPTFNCQKRKKAVGT